MKILVAGGSGFLGSHLCEKLLLGGHEVVCLDNGMTGRLANIESFLLNPSFSFINHDIKDSIDLELDGIFNLACPASPPKYQRNPVDTFMTSILGSKNLLELAIRNSCVILQASTSEVYGDPEVNPQIEDYWGNVNSFGMRSCYDEGKRGAETLFHDFYSQFGADIRVARIFNTYGPKMSRDDGRVVSNFINQALRNQPITVYGNGDQVRSLCYVSDLIEGLIRLFFTPGVHRPINLGNPQPVTMFELANEIIALCESRSEIVHRELPPDDPKTRIPDIQRAQLLLDWTPTINRGEGLEKTINYFKFKLDA
jgi:UDP-glucuronate decarboxylase